MAALDLDTDKLKQVGALVDAAGTSLTADLGEDAAAPGGDEVSQTLVANLNARRRWLTEHVRAGFSQTQAAADGIDTTAQAYQSEDSAAASTYGDSGGTYVAPTSSAVAPSMTAPAGLPASTAMPDISGQDGHQLALALEAGAGAGPVSAASIRCAALAQQAQACAAQLLSAQEQLLAAGHSEVHAPLLARLTRAVTWTQNVAAQAATLSTDYAAAGAGHTTVLSFVGPSTGWQTLKTAYSEALAENTATLGAAQPRVDALAAALNTWQQESSTAMSTYQSAGDAMSVTPADIGDPGLAPTGQSPPVGEESNNDEDDGEDASTSAEELGDAGSGAQDMLSPIVGAVAPLAQSLGKMNPLQSVTQAASQLGQQVGQLGQSSALNPSSAIRPAALTNPLGNTSASPGSNGISPGSGINPSSAGPGASVHPAAAVSTPSAGSQSPGAVSPAGQLGASSSRTGMGTPMGMMPSSRSGDGAQSQKVNNYGDTPLPDVDADGQPGILGDTTAAQPAITAEAKNAVLTRIERRRKDLDATAT